MHKSSTTEIEIINKDTDDQDNDRLSTEEIRNRRIEKTHKWNTKEMGNRRIRRERKSIKMTC